VKASQAFTPSSAEEGSFPPRLFPNNAQSKNSVSLELNRGFTSNGRANTATIFDLKTLKILGQVKTGTNPDAILYDPSSQRVFAFNGRSKDVTVFDAATGVVASMIALGGKPEFAIADSKGRV
jgi:DNA-binding beta-propeller fold protein YncE